MAIEAIATLVNIKKAMVELLLKPAGVPAEVYGPLLVQRDPTSGRPFSKRQLAPLILDAVEKRPDCSGVVRAIIEIAAHWSSFHLADDEFAARATVQKAREIIGTIELMEAREAKQRELARKEELARTERERAELFTKHSELLLMMFDDLSRAGDEQRRGYLLQDLLNRVFDLYGIPVVSSFTRNERGEQIDGAFKLEGWHYLVECRWRERLADIRQLDGLKGQVDRSGKQTMGLFLSINGWSDHVCPLLKQNPDKCIILMDGYDLRTVLAAQVDLQDFLLAKVSTLNLETEPFLSVRRYLAELGR
ncbi:MAG: hypothetical protein M1305_00180 [Candidatus Marsarchaeota archaeon]|nr:hypothetical protein [Candidatus Marsarchaeota archaeon]